MNKFTITLIAAAIAVVLLFIGTKVSCIIGGIIAAGCMFTCAYELQKHK